MLSEIKFQYILCYGSTDLYRISGTASLYFNTSYVTVQRKNCSWSANRSNISIHLMLRFNNIVF